MDETIFVIQFWSETLKFQTTLLMQTSFKLLIDMPSLITRLYVVVSPNIGYNVNNV